MEVIAKTLKDYRDLKVARMEVSQCLGFMQLDAKIPPEPGSYSCSATCFFQCFNTFLEAETLYTKETLWTPHDWFAHACFSPATCRWHAGSHGHMLASRCSTISWRDRACAISYNFTFYIGYMYSTSCSNFQLCSDQGITCHQSLAESSHLSKHEAGRIWKVKVSFQPWCRLHPHGGQDAQPQNVLFPCMKHHETL